MRKYLLLATVIGVLSVPTAGPLLAKTYRCEASPKIAAIGVSDNASVSITEDYQNQECRFSVNGEPVGSPPREMVIGAQNTLRAGGGKNIKDNLNQLGLAILASSPLPAVPPDLSVMLQSNADALQKCFDALAAGKPDIYVSNPLIRCQVLHGSEPYNIKLGNRTLNVRPTRPGAPPQLVISILLSGNLGTHLFIPQIYMGGILQPLQ